MNWKPKVGEWYFSVCVDLTGIYWRIYKCRNIHTCSGNCYRTRREAEVGAKRVLAVIRKGGAK